MTLTDAIALAEAVARDGLEPHREQIPGVVRLARNHGVHDPLVDALDDPDGPAVARIRALGRIVFLLASTSRAPSDGTNRAIRPTRLTRETLSDRSLEESAMHPFMAQEIAEDFQTERLAHPPLHR